MLVNENVARNGQTELKADHRKLTERSWSEGANRAIVPCVAVFSKMSSQRRSESRECNRWLNAWNLFRVVAGREGFGRSGHIGGEALVVNAEYKWGLMPHVIISIGEPHQKLRHQNMRKMALLWINDTTASCSPDSNVGTVIEFSCVLMTCINPRELERVVQLCLRYDGTGQLKGLRL